MTTEVELAPHPDRRVLSGEVDGAIVLFHLADRRLHVLNASAGAIWSELPAARTVDELADGLAERFGLDPAGARLDVERLIARLLADGLLDDGDPADDLRGGSPFPGPSPETAWSSATAAPPSEAACVPGSGSYAALDARVRVVGVDHEVLSVLGTVLEPLAATATPTSEVRIAEAPERGWTVSVDGDSPTLVGSRLAAVLRTLAEINELAVASAPADLVFHAGSVGDAGGVALLPAASNHGKSTLTTALVRGGLGYLTDEAAMVTGALTVRPFPKAIALDPGSFPLFADLAPEFAGDLGVALGGREWHVAPRDVGRVGEEGPVRVVICPHWRAGAATRLHRVDPIEALHELLGLAFDFTGGGQPVFDRLVRLVTTVPVYRLGYSDLDEAVGVVTALLQEPDAVPSPDHSGARRTLRRSPAGS